MVMAKTEKLNKWVTHFSMKSIMELNELIYTGAKLLYAKIGVPLRDTKRNSKPAWKIRLETQIRNIQQAKMQIKIKNAGICCDEERRTTQQVNQTIKLGDKSEATEKKGKLKRYRENNNTDKTTKNKSPCK